MFPSLKPRPVPIFSVHFPNGIHRASVRVLGIVVAVAAVLAACSERPTTALTAPEAQPALSEVAASAGTAPEGYDFGCPPRPFVAQREVAPGTAEDLNGNGVVCDEQPEDTDTALVWTLDDVLLPVGIPLPSAGS